MPNVDDSNSPLPQTVKPVRLLDRVRDAIRLRHYSYRTEQCYDEGPCRKRRRIPENSDDRHRKLRGIRPVGAARSPVFGHPKKWNQNN